MSGRVTRALRFAAVGAMATLVIANLDVDNWADLAGGPLDASAILASEAAFGFVIGFLLGYFNPPRARPPKVGRARSTKPDTRT